MSGGRVLFVNKQTRQSLIKEIIQTTVIHSQNELLRELKTVSYTHLTLPTNREV